MPTRLASLVDTVYRLAEAKINGNPESTVGFLTMAGDRVDVHVSPTRDLGKFLTCLKAITPSGESDIVTGIKIANLTLKNRPNRAHRPRIVLFVGSPVTAKENELVSLGAQLKKNGVALDIIHFGTENSSNANEALLGALLNSVQNSNNSHMVTVPPGPHGLAQAVLTSAVMGDDRPSGFTGRGAVGSSFGMGDEEDDPELMAAIRASMEEAERATLQQAAQASVQQNGGAAAAAAASAPTAAADYYNEDEDPEVLAAIALSLQTNEMEDRAAAATAAAAATNTTSSTNTTNNTNSAPAATEGTSQTEGKQNNQSAAASANANETKSEQEQLEDPAFMDALLRDAGFDASFLHEDSDKTKKEEDKK